MTAYYVSPYTVTNGTGTWASPYSTNSSGRATLVAGDEIRVVSKPILDILDTTVYTATLTDYRTLTITAGGGLGADFSTSTVCYLPQFDTFFRVTAVVGNAINVGTSSCLPIYNSTVNIGVVVQRVLASAIPLTSPTQYIWPSLTSNVTITDGWIADGVQLLDGSAKSLITNPSSSVTFRVDNTSNTIVQRTNVTIDLGQTHVITGIGTTANTSTIISSGGANTILGQVATHTSGTPTINIGSGSSAPSIGGSLRVKHMSGYAPMAGIYARNMTITLDNTAMRYGDFFIYTASSTQPLFLVDCTLNLGNLISGGPGSGSGLFYGNLLASNTINITGTLDCYGSISNQFITNILGDYTLTLGPSVQIFNARRTSSITSFLYRYRAGSENFGGMSIFTVPIINPGSFPITTADVDFGSGTISTNGLLNSSPLHKQPTLIRIDTPYPVTNISRYPQGAHIARNVVLTTRNGSIDPIEILGIDAAPYSTTLAATNCPVVRTDATTFRTTGPSLRAELTIRSVANWPSYARSIKTIKIPVTGGLSYTVSGYIRQNMAGYVNGDCRMSLVFDNADVAFQDMSITSFNSWEPFSLTFTASYTGEAILAWEMYYRQAGIMWLDDLTIS